MKAIEAKKFLKKMQKLEPLDLSKCETIGQLLDGMSRCSFGARCLGEAAETIVGWIEKSRLPCVVCDQAASPLDDFLLSWWRKWWSLRPYRSEELLRVGSRNPVIVIGNYSAVTEDALYEELGEVIFINSEGRCKPGQIKDGYFPNVVFTDPLFIVSLLTDVLDERLNDRKISVLESLKNAASFGGIAVEVLKAVHVFEAMIRDQECTVFSTFSGAMTVAQMSFLISDIIENGWTDCIFSTGALMAHGLIAGTGLSHYKYDPRFDDGVLARLGMNRVTDTLEPETNFDHIDEVMNAVLEEIPPDRAHSPIHLHRRIGMYLASHPKYKKMRSILKSAYEHDVPVVVPAFHDSELGNDHYTHNLLRQQKGRVPLVMNQELDTEELLELFTSAKRLGIFSIGGGYPRNHAQNLAPLTEIINARGAAKLPVKKFMYGCRIDPQLPWHGGMGGCTYEENMSWRKFYRKAATAQIRGDATIFWPIIQRALMDRFEQEPL